MMLGYDGTPCYLPSGNCPINYAYWQYRPSFNINTTFLVLFGLSFIAFIVQGAMNPKWLAFSGAMAAGCALEVIGYIGRIMAYSDMFAEVNIDDRYNGSSVVGMNHSDTDAIQNPFLIQIVCLTIGPAFLAAGLYLCLSRIVTTIGSEHSHIKPYSYPKIFIPCDVVSLALQAIGGGMASVAIHRGEKSAKGDRVMIAGLAFQVATMFAFILVSADFAWSTFHNRKALSLPVPNQSHKAIRQSRSFKAFLIALTLSTLCIFTRCVFRVAELSEGWRGHLATTQKYFTGLEGAVVIASVLVLNLCHPAFCFKDAESASAMQPEKKIWFGRSRSAANHGEASETELMKVTTGLSK